VASFNVQHSTPISENSTFWTDFFLSIYDVQMTGENSASTSLILGMPDREKVSSRNINILSNLVR